jgi:hypothetical protein
MADTIISQNIDTSFWITLYNIGKLKQSTIQAFER